VNQQEYSYHPAAKLGFSAIWIPTIILVAMKDRRDISVRLPAEAAVVWAVAKRVENPYDMMTRTQPLYSPFRLQETDVQ
jgi:hypothetical protein